MGFIHPPFSRGARRPSSSEQGLDLEYGLVLDEQLSQRRLRGCAAARRPHLREVDAGFDSSRGQGWDIQLVQLGQLGSLARSVEQ